MIPAQEVRLAPDEWRIRYDEMLELQQQHSMMHQHAPTSEAARPAASAPATTLGDAIELERRIEELQALFSRAGATEDGCEDHGQVCPGYEVGVRWEDGEEATYCIVGPDEVDPRSGCISYRSPIGRALIGRRRGDRVRVATPSGATYLEVLFIQVAK